jgi:hypothetical protein
MQILNLLTVLEIMTKFLSSPSGGPPVGDYCSNEGDRYLLLEVGVLFFTCAYQILI